MLTISPSLHYIFGWKGREEGGENHREEGRIAFCHFSRLTSTISMICILSVRFDFISLSELSARLFVVSSLMVLLFVV